MVRSIFIITLFFLFNYIYAECSDLDSSECAQWAEYCEWNEDTDQCQDIGGGSGDEFGPYDILSITQSDGMRDGPLYADATLYYPISSELLPLTNIIIGPGWSGDGSSMDAWAYFFASYGFIATTIDYNDPVNESHQQRAEAMLDLIETVKLENIRSESPVFDQIDTTKFAVTGYSLSGGVTQIVAMLDSTIDALIALNPTIIIEDCEGCADFQYCICLLPEHLDHNVPTLIISGENEINELPSYDGLLGADQYINTPETTTKMLYEIENGDHGSAYYPSADGFIQSKALNWVKYHLMDSTDVCEILLEEPNDASQFLTTLDCNTSISYDFNNDGSIDNTDLTMLITVVINGSLSPFDINHDLAVDLFDILILSDYLQSTLLNYN